MANKITNGIGLRRDWEAKGIGLNAFGSYVLRSFDSDEWLHVQQVDFQNMEFPKEDHVVVARGTLGTLANLARVTEDHRYARYFGDKFISVALIQGEVFTKSDFISSIASNPTARVVHLQSGTERVGIVHGDLNKTYKTLVYPAGNGFNFLDLEEKPPPQSLDMMVKIKEIDPVEGDSVKQLLQESIVHSDS
jgi:hypothetical protein